MHSLLPIIISIAINTASELESTINSLGRPLGLVVVSIIEIPVVILFLAAIFGKPRSFKITALFLGWITVVFCLFIGSVYVLSSLLGIFY